MKKQFFSLSIRSLMLLFCLPFVLLVLLSCSYFYRAGKEEITDLIQANAVAIIGQTSDTLEQKIAAVSNLPTTITASSYYYKLRKNILADREPLSAENYRGFSNAVHDFLVMNSSYFNSVFLFLDDYTVSMFRSNTGEQLRRSNFCYEDFSEVYPPYSLHWITSASEPYPYSTFSGRLPAASLMEVLGSPDSAVHGVMVFGIDDRLFTTSLINCKITASSCVTLVKDGKLQFSSSELFGTDTLEKLSEEDLHAISALTGDAVPETTITRQFGENYVIYRPLAYENMGVLAVIPMEEMYMNYHRFSDVAIKFSLLLLTVCLALYFTVTNLLTRPISSLMEQLNYVSENHLDTAITAWGGKEINQICKGINHMIGRIKLLMKNLEFEMLAKQEAELQALYFQINPHFLYNALDCVHQLCDLGEVEKAGQMVDQLAAFYRIGVSKGMVAIPLRDELTHVEMYLAILKTRFEDFQYEISVPAEYWDCSIIKLVLQPIVENAVYHGLRPCRTDGTIRITAEKEGSCLLIHISDDGGGIPDRLLEDIRASLYCSMSEKPAHIYGIKNVHDRLQLTYGFGYGLTIDSVLEEGTTVTLRIPYQILSQKQGTQNTESPRMNR